MPLMTARKHATNLVAPIQSSGLRAEIIERKDTPGAYGVEAIDIDADGAVYMAVFYGPDSKERALEYANAKYAEVRVS